jgi:hypothetical protein
LLSSFFEALEIEQIQLKVTQQQQGQRLERHDERVDDIDSTISKLTNHFNKYRSIMDECIAKNERADAVKADPVLALDYHTFQTNINMNGVYTAAMSVSSGYIDVVNHGKVAEAAHYLENASKLVEIIPIIGATATVACDLVKAVLDTKAERDTRERLGRVNGVTGNPTEWLEFVAELACDLAEAKAASVRAIYNTPTCLDPTDTKTKLVGFLKSTAIGQMVSKVYDIMVEACSSPVQKYASADALLCLGIIMCRDQPTSLLSLHRTLMTATQQHQVVLDTSTPSSLTASSTS